MARLFTTVCVVIALAFPTGRVQGEDEAASEFKPHRGEITKMDSEGRTFTVKLKDKDGKEVEKTFKLTRGAKFYDGSGKAAELEVFRSGDQIVLLGRKGEVNELRKAGKPVRAEILDIDRTSGTVKVKMKDEDGKEVEKTFKLTGTIRYMDSLGRAAHAKVFRSGDQVAVIINKDRLEEMNQVEK